MLEIDGRRIVVAGECGFDGLLAVVVDGIRRRMPVLEHELEIAVFLESEGWQLVEVDPLAAHTGEDPTAGRLTAPMPGRVTQLIVEPGMSVRRGQPLMVIEAMKMEHTVSAPADGIVEAVRVAVGDQVEEGAELIAFAAAERQGQT